MRRVAAAVIGAWGVTSAATASAATVAVSSAGELTAAVGAAKAGDEIVLAAGTYAMTDVSCSASGTAAAPIVIRAAAPLAARIDFSGVEGFKVSGAYWTFQDLEVHGACAADDDCEHAFHVTGGADGFVLRGNKVVDFNAQLKVNAAQVGTAWTTPKAGLVEYNELFDTRPRNTSNPVTKANLDTGEGWIIRGNSIHDFFRADGSPTYGSFMKSGSKNGLYERNLVICQKDVTSSGTQIGLSFGGGGTGAQFCAPAFDANVPCNIEHSGGTMQNNVIVNCSDVGIYLNRAQDTKLFHNTLIATSGIDFRFDTTSGVARGNVLTGDVHVRDGAQTPTLSDNLTAIALADFSAMYMNPMTGDLRKKGDLSALIGKVAVPPPGVVDDYCARTRTAPFDLGALQHSLGDCVTTSPPVAAGSPGGATDGGIGSPNGSGSDSGAGSASGSGGASVGDGGAGTESTSAGANDTSSDGGCSQAPTGATSAGGGQWLVMLTLGAMMRRRRAPR